MLICFDKPILLFQEKVKVDQCSIQLKFDQQHLLLIIDKAVIIKFQIKDSYK
jgi:hypothetical protein